MSYSLGQPDASPPIVNPALLAQLDEERRQRLAAMNPVDRVAFWWSSDYNKLGVAVWGVLAAAVGGGAWWLLRKRKR